MPLIIRPAAAADRAFVVGLATRLAGFTIPPWRTRDEIIEGDRRALESWFDTSPPGEAMLVAEWNGRSCGCGYVMTVVDYFNQRPHAHLSVLAVSQDAEGVGIGTALIEACEAWAKRQGFDRLTLNTLSNNHRACRLYERLGFVGESVRYVKPL